MKYQPNIEKQIELIIPFIKNIKPINYFPILKISNDLGIKTIIGIGGSHIYYGQIKKGSILKENILPLPTPKYFFRDIIFNAQNLGYINNKIKMINCIFSYPFESIEKNGLIRGKYTGDKNEGKKTPFNEKNFFIDDILQKYIPYHLDFTVVNDSVSTNIYNMYLNKDYDLYISVLSGTGVNFSYTKDDKVINTEIGRAKILKNPFTNELVPIQFLTSHQNIKKISKKYRVDYTLLEEQSAKILASIILGIIKSVNSKKTSIIAQGSFITIDINYFEKIYSFLKQYLQEKDFIFIKDNKADIKGASLI